MARHCPPTRPQPALPDPRPATAGPGAAYAGEDWLLVVDRQADYTHSEAIAPFLLLAEPGQTLHIHSPDGLLADTSVSRHRAGSLSAVGAPAPGAAFLYVDPLSATGRVLQAAPQAIGLGQPVPPALWTGPWFQRLLHAQAAAHEVRHWVDALVQAQGLLPDAQAKAVDWRLRSVARRLADDVDGRLNLAELAAQVHCSPEHLRKEFRRAAGLSLSRYQMWCRVARLLGQGADGQAAAGTQPDPAEALHQAGFYDTPHGSRAVRRYLGVSMVAVTRDRHPITACPGRAGAGPAAGAAAGAPPG